MQRIASNDLGDTGPIEARPSIILPNVDLGTSPTNNLAIGVFHGGGSEALRLRAFSHSGGLLDRVGTNAPTGAIIGTPSVAFLRDDLLVTSVHGQGSNRLRLMSWRVSENGTVFRRMHDSGTQIGTPNGTCDLVWLGGPRLCVAARTEGGDLKLIAFDVSGSGEFDRISDSGTAAGGITSPPSICHASLIQTSDGLPTRADPGDITVATTFRSNNGRLKLISWRVSRDRVHRLRDTGNEGNTIQGRPALVQWPGTDIVVAAVRDAATNRLRMIGWQVDPNSGRFRNEMNLLTNFSMQDSAGMTFAPGLGGQGRVATAVVASGGEMRVILWNIVRNGTALVGFDHLSDSGLTDRRVAGSPSICPSILGLTAETESRDFYTAARLSGSNELAIDRWSE